MKPPELIKALMVLPPDIDIVVTHEEYIDCEDSCGITIIRDIDTIKVMDMATITPYPPHSDKRKRLIVIESSEKEQ